MATQVFILLVVFYLIFFILSLTLFLKFRQEILIKQLIVFVLIILAVLSHNYSVDYGNHVAMYNEAVAGILKHEISYYLLARFVDLFSGTPLYAVMGVTVKYKALSQLTEFLFPSLLIYFSYFFILHDVTQIRAGVSSAFVLMSITALPDRNKFRFFIFAFLAVLFHYSALIILPLIFLNGNRIQIIYFFLIPLGFIIWALNINLSGFLSHIHFEQIQVKYQTYLQLAASEQIDLINLLSFSRIIFCYILLWKWEYLAEKSRYAVVIIKIYILSSLSFIVFSDIPTLAFRVSELLGIVEIVLIPYILYLIKNRTIGKLILSFIALGFLCLTLLYERIIAF